MPPLQFLVQQKPGMSSNAVCNRRVQSRAQVPLQTESPVGAGKTELAVCWKRCSEERECILTRKQTAHPPPRLEDVHNNRPDITFGSFNARDHVKSGGISDDD